MLRPSWLQNLFGRSHRHHRRGEIERLAHTRAAVERLEDRRLLAVTTIFDEATFLAQTGAEPRVTLADEIWSAGSSYTENGVTIQHADNDDVRIGERTPLYEGNELALDGMENINVLFDEPVTAFGIEMQDGYQVGWIGASGANSVFDVTVKSGSETLDTFTVDPPVDERYFIGVTSSKPFDRIEIREVQGGIENDFFHHFYATSSFMAECGTSDLVVTNTADSGHGSLRWAIEQSNTNPGEDQIVFNIPQTDPRLDDIDGDGLGDVYVIQPASALPALTDDGTTIDARTQTVFTGDTNPPGPEIVIDGSLLRASSNGLTLLSDHNQVFHLTIQHAPAYGIRVDQGSGNWIAGNFLGTDATGTAPAGNGQGGIGITRGHDNVIGTNGDGQDDVAERNLISGNLGTGVEICWNSSGNRVAGNRIGTEHTGLTALGNGAHGVHITSPNNFVGTESMMSFIR